MEKEIKSEVIRFRISEIEKKEVKNWLAKNTRYKIRRKKITESSLIRSLLRWFLKKDFPLSNDQITDMRKTARDLSSIAGNLNQLTKAYNEGLIVVPVDTEDFLNNLYTEVRRVNKNQKRLIALIERGLDYDLQKVFTDE